MSVLKETCDIIVQILQLYGVNYITPGQILSALKNQDDVSEILFHTLIEILLQEAHSFTAEETKDVWKTMNFTLPDFVYFVENTLVEKLHYRLFLSKFQIKQLKQISSLQSKAILTALLFVLFNTNHFDQVLQNQFNVQNKTLNSDDCLNQQVPNDNIRTTQVIVQVQHLFQQQQRLISQIEEQYQKFKGLQQTQPQNENLLIFVTFYIKLLTKLFNEMLIEQKQRLDSENYLNSIQQVDFVQLFTSKLMKYQIHTQQLNIQNKSITQNDFGQNQVRQVDSQLDQYIDWVKQEFWLE